MIWAGANDGPVHVTRDGGASWEEVTPRGLPPGGRVDSVEPSPHDPGVAYIAVLRYQLGDYRPWIYRTDNYGKRWTLLSGRDSGIPADAPVRVVREDPVRRGLLYAGTESGVFVSFDEGRSWEPLQQNLPVTPVTDIRVHRGDLVLSTMGRGFWILDNVSVLRQAPLPELPAAGQLFAPDTALRYRPAAGDDDDDRGGVPSYPTPAAIIDYYLPEAAPDTLLLEILDADGSIVNSFTVAAQDAAQSAGDDQSPEMDMALNRPAAAALAHLPRDPGLNRFRWDMRHRGPWHEDADKRFTDGPLARPGVYTVRLTVGERVLEQPLTLRGDPRVSDLGVSDADIDAQVALQLEISALLGDARRLAQQLSSEQEQTDGREVERGGVVTEVLAALETAEGTYQQPMLIDQIEYLASMLAGADQRPGADAFERFEALLKRFEELQQLAGG